MTERSEMDSLLSYISDAHKDAYGFRPRGQYQDLSLEELRVVADELSQAVADSIREQNEREAAAAAAFELRVAEVIATGARDRETALRWIFEADDIMEEVSMYGGSYASYELGLPYRYFEVEFPSYPKAA